jgi:excisionase family DNA binding protein
MSAQGRTTTTVVAGGTQNISLDDPWLDLKMGAALALVSVATLRREAKSGRLRVTKVGGRRHLRVRKSWIDAWLLAGTPQVEAER